MNWVRIIAVTSALALAAPAAAVAQSPFAPLPPAQPDQSQVQTTPVSNSSTVDNGGLTRFQEVLIFLGGVALIGGIGFAILSDARRRAPVRQDELVSATPGQGSHKHVNKDRQRKKAKAARAARKRNKR